MFLALQQLPVWFNYPMKVTRFTVAFLLLAVSLSADSLRLNTHKQVKAGDKYVGKTDVTKWDAKKTAVVICEMWSKHWCASATGRVGEMAPRMNAVVEAARKKGCLIIHCPSGGVKLYADTPMRKLAADAPKVETKIPLQGWCYLDDKHEAKLPIDDSDGGCDCLPRCSTKTKMDRHQVAIIKMEKGDAITASAEAFYLMKQRGIKNVIVMGVHTNMCVLGRPFSIR
jgi:nicotinamidase-related amidase